MKAEFEILEGNILFTDWHEGPMTIDEVKVIMEEMLVIMEREGVLKYIDDISKCEVDWKVADEWIVGDWFERALALGVVKNALIVPVGTEMSHDGEQCTIRSFNSMEDALKWIHEPPKKADFLSRLKEWFGTLFK
jgi:hypothetical protein